MPTVFIFINPDTCHILRSHIVNNTIEKQTITIFSLSPIKNVSTSVNQASLLQTRIGEKANIEFRSSSVTLIAGATVVTSLGMPQWSGAARAA